MARAASRHADATAAGQAARTGRPWSRSSTRRSASAATRLPASCSCKTATRSAATGSGRLSEPLPAELKLRISGVDGRYYAEVDYTPAPQTSGWVARATPRSDPRVGGRPRAATTHCSRLAVTANRRAAARRRRPCRLPTRVPRCRPRRSRAGQSSHRRDRTARCEAAHDTHTPRLLAVGARGGRSWRVRSNDAGVDAANGPTGANASSARRSSRALASVDKCIAVACVINASALPVRAPSWTVITPVYTVVAPSTAARIHSRPDQSRRIRVPSGAVCVVIVRTTFHAGRVSRYYRFVPRTCPCGQVSDVEYRYSPLRARRRRASCRRRHRWPRRVPHQCAQTRARPEPRSRAPVARNYDRPPAPASPPPDTLPGRSARRAPRPARERATASCPDSRETPRAVRSHVGVRRVYTRR